MPLWTPEEEMAKQEANERRIKKDCEAGKHCLHACPKNEGLVHCCHCPHHEAGKDFIAYSDVYVLCREERKANKGVGAVVNRLKELQREKDAHLEPITCPDCGSYAVLYRLEYAIPGRDVVAICPRCHPEQIHFA